MSRIKKNRSGFTLIELLLAVTLFLVAAGAVTAFMVQGIKIFSRLSGASQEEEAAIFMIKMTRDLRNMVFYTLLPFQGDEDQILFASLEDLSDVGGEPDPSPFQVSYRYDTEGARIVRQVVRPQTFERAESTRTETVLNGAGLLKFAYEGDPSQIPRRVTVRVEYRGRFGKRSITQDVLVPAAPVRTEAP